MATQYSWYYAMWKLQAWTEDRKPDDFSSSNADLQFNPLDFLESFDFDVDPNPQPQLGNNITTGFGIHLQKTLYVDPALRKVLRIFGFNELERNYPGYTKLQLNTFREADALGAFKQGVVTLKAVNENNVYPYFSKEHTTTFVISSCAFLSKN